MTKNLVIVESPAKAKTIEKFLGKDFTVKSCYGHIRDLSKEKLGVDIENNFEPNYEISADKKKLVKELKKLAKEAEQIWLATDEDREGEAISWHLLEALGIDESQTKRIVFHEITKKAIKKAIENPRSLNKSLVDAQQARRILDRLVGFELSPVLWKKIKPSLSAGRVQSVAVRLIVEREREIMGFEAENFFKVSASFHPVKDGKIQNALIKAELPSRLKTVEEAREFLQECANSSFDVESVEKKPGKRSPAAPFTTSTLQQEASRKLSFPPSSTMRVAQKLYEAGYITYMRTDSVNLSDEALQSAEREIKSNYGDNYFKRRTYKTKSQGAQEAHEAIRPTELGRNSVNMGGGEQKLYELIWKRTIASQMADAQLERTNVKINISKSSRTLSAHGEVIKFDGFLKVYFESSDDEQEDQKIEKTLGNKALLPPLEKGQKLSLIEAQSTEGFTRPPARYTEASLVKKLEELGIGRPSTYAPTISTIQNRGYVEKSELDGKLRDYRHLEVEPESTVKEETKQETTGADKGKLVPSNVGMVVNDFLLNHFDEIMDYNFTASVEKEFDEIASGGKQWRQMLDRFYNQFHPKVEETEKVDRVNGERFLGDDPKSGKKIYAKIGRYGPYVQKGSGDEEEKPEYAKLRQGQLIESISLEDALELFKLPRDLGEFEGEKISVNIGRYGPYVRHKNLFASIPKDEDPYEIELDRAVELIKEKQEIERKKNINQFEHDGDTLKVLRGRYGPYISFKKTNYKIPKGTDPEKLKLEDCIAIIEDPKNAPKKGRKKGSTKKGSAKKKTGGKKSSSKSAKKTAKS